MQPTYLSIGDLLHQRQPFVIPKYQRAYAWDNKNDKRQIEDFIEDLRKCLELRIAGSPRTHFFGGIVSIYEAMPNRQGRRYEVIDGQQRLATFTILFSLIAREYENISREARENEDENNSNIASTLAFNLRQELITYNDIRSDGTPIECLRLVLSNADNIFFERAIKNIDFTPPNETNRESHHRLYRAIQSIGEFIQGLTRERTSTQEKINLICHLEATAKDDCWVIHLVTDSRGEAYRLFQVLNDRGVGLTEGDLLRSSTLEMLEGTSLQTEAEILWDEILSDEFEKIEDFLRAFYASNQGSRAGKRTLFDDFYKDFFRTSQISQNATQSADPVLSSPINFVSPLPNPSTLQTLGINERNQVHNHVLRTIKNMENEVKVFRFLYEGEWPYTESGRSVSEWDRQRLRLLVVTLKHTLCIPLLMAAYLLGEDKFSEIVQMLELFIFRYIIICKQHPGRLSTKYLRNCLSIREDPRGYRVSDLRNDLLELQARATDELFETSIREKMVYTENGGNGYLRYFLTTIDQYSGWYRQGANGRPRCLDKTTVYDLSQIEIEHIYPRRAGDSSIESLEPLKHTHGNLSFWGSHDNGAAGNEIFEIKRNIYRTSNVGMNRELIEFDEWTRETVVNRATDLIERAKRIFRV